MEPRIADAARLEESYRSRPPSEIRLSAKMREKLENLDDWRVDASQLKFAVDGPRIEGGFAVVCRASLVTDDGGWEDEDEDMDNSDLSMDGQTEMDVAVKMMKIKDGGIYQALRRAVQEANIITDLNHANIITLEGFVEDLSNEKIWLIFPWAELGNVKDFILSQDWSIPERIWLIDDVACGVEHLHSQEPPICHGDLKSINILVNSEFRAIITDFGSARRLSNIGEEGEQEHASVQSTTADKTKLSVKFCQDSNTMTFTGTKYTLRWAAPEVLEEEDAGTAADIWSVGWVFYEIMTGSVPFETLKKDSAITLHIMKGELPSLKDHERMSPVLSLVSLMMMCWEVSPERRPAAERCCRYTSLLPMCPPRSKQSPNAAVETAKRLLEEGDMYRVQNRYDKALAVFNSALELLNNEDATIKEKADILRAIAEVHRARGEYDKAATLYVEVLQFRAKIGDQSGKADAQWGLAEIHRARGEYEEAATLHAESMQVCEEIGDRPGKAYAQRGLAEIHRLRNEYDKATTLYAGVIQFCEETGDRPGKAYAQRGLAEVHQLRDEYDKATALYGEVIQDFEEIGDRAGKAYAQRGLAAVHRARKEYARSLELYTESSQLYRAYGIKSGLAHVLRGLADVYHDLENFQNATQLYEEAAQLFAGIGLAKDASIALDNAAGIRQKCAELPESV